VSVVQLFAVTGSHGAGPPSGTELIPFRDLAAVVGEPLAAGDPELAHYRRVVESVFRRQAVLPAPPGTTFRDQGLVLQWLELHYFTLLEALGVVEEQVVARVTVVRAPVHEPGEVLDEAAETVLQDALRVLRRHATASVILDGDGAGHPAAASFLVEEAQWDGFALVVQAESGRLPDFTLSLSGPWPPYDFVRMQF
jgi:hypothetical protein